MDDRSKLFLIITQAGIIVLLLTYIVVFPDYSGKIREMEEEIENLQTLNAECINRNDSLAVQLQKMRIENAVPPFLDKHQLEYLNKQGLSNPVEDIRTDLVANPDLIGRPAVLGGKMGFYFRDGIHLLNHRWVFAYYEDGHVEGAMLLRYEIADDGTLSWEVLNEAAPAN